MMDGLLNIRATPTPSFSSPPFPGIILQPLLRALQFISDDNKTSSLVLSGWKICRTGLILRLIAF